MIILLAKCSLLEIVCDLFNVIVPKAVSMEVASEDLVKNYPDAALISALMSKRTIQGSALRLEALSAGLKEYTVRIFYGNDSRILTALLQRISVWAYESGSRASVSSNENAPSPKFRAGKRIERSKGTAEYLTAG